MYPRRAALPCVVAALALAAPARADVFDNYTRPLLAKAVDGANVKEAKRLTSDELLEHDRVVPGVDDAVVIVRTNEGRFAKLAVEAGARQRVGEDRSLPILIVDRFVTFKEGEERQILASGRTLRVFPGFRVSLDLGQVVPEEVGGDVRFVADGDKTYLEPLGKAKLYLLVKHLPEADPKKTEKLAAGEKFEPRYFNGKFKLYDDGRRSGELVLKVDDDGSVSGAYYSDKDGAKYDVAGRVGMPEHSVRFTVKFPRSEQTFQGWLFTGDGKYLTGSSRLNEREAGFFAARVEE
jgi:hypothetical protein